MLIVSLFCVSQTFAEIKADIKSETQTTEITQVADVYSFSKNPETTTSVAETPESNKVATVVIEEDVTPTEEILLADAQTLIRDKLVEKYQVRLDKIMEQLAKKLAGVPAEVQRKALVEVQARIAEKKTLILAKKNIDPMKLDITVTILDHITLRIEGMIQQSAQTIVTTPA